MSSSCRTVPSESLDEQLQTKSKLPWYRLISCCCCFSQRRKKPRVVPILKPPKLRPSARSENASRGEKVQIRMSLVEERQLTPVTTGAAYPKPSIDKRRKLIAAAHEFSQLMSFNRIEVETEKASASSKGKRRPGKFQLYQVRRSANEKARNERELAKRLAALELRLRDLDEEVMSSSSTAQPADKEQDMMYSLRRAKDEIRTGEPQKPSATGASGPSTEPWKWEVDQGGKRPDQEGKKPDPGAKVELEAKIPSQTGSSLEAVPAKKASGSQMSSSTQTPSPDSSSLSTNSSSSSRTAGKKVSPGSPVPRDPTDSTAVTIKLP